MFPSFAAGMSSSGQAPRPRPPPPPTPPRSWRRDELKRVHDSVLHLLQSEVFVGILVIFKEAPFEVIKGWSHSGAVCRKHVAVDLTNWVYAIFYLLLVEHAEAGHPILRYADRFPSTLNHTRAGKEKAGDVVEMVLGYWRSADMRQHPTMAVIPPALHYRFNQHLDGGLKALERLLVDFDRALAPDCLRAGLVNAFQFYDF